MQFKNFPRKRKLYCILNYLCSKTYWPKYEIICSAFQYNSYNTVWLSEELQWKSFLYHRKFFFFLMLVKHGFLQLLVILDLYPPLIFYNPYLNLSKLSFIFYNKYIGRLSRRIQTILFGW